ncbi:hypothetical protein GQ457_10G001590 [Hibiscus cannabinus]
MTADGIGSTEPPKREAGAPAASTSSKASREKGREGQDDRKKRKMNDPIAPKKGLSGYMFFAQEERENEKRSNPGVSFLELARIIGDRWRRMTWEEQESYEAKARINKKRYDDEKKGNNNPHPMRIDSGNESTVEDADFILVKDDGCSSTYAGKRGDEKEKSAMKAAAAASSSSAKASKKKGREEQNEQDEGKKRRRMKYPDSPKRPLSVYMFFALSERNNVKRSNPGLSLPEVAQIIEDRWRKMTKEEKEQYEANARIDTGKFQIPFLNLFTPRFIALSGNLSRPIGIGLTAMTTAAGRGNTDEDFVLVKDDGGSPTDARKSGDEKKASDFRWKLADKLYLSLSYIRIWEIQGPAKKEPPKKEAGAAAASAASTSSKASRKNGREGQDNRKNKRKKKDPIAPNKWLSGFMFFAREERENVKRSNPGVSFREIPQIIRDRWRKMTLEEQEPYEAKSRIDKKRYEDEKEGNNNPHPMKIDSRNESAVEDEDFVLFKAASDAKASKKKGREEQDEGKKKKKKKRRRKYANPPLSVYMFFALSESDNVKRSNPGLSLPEVAKIIEDRWRKMTKEEKEQYEANARIKLLTPEMDPTDDGFANAQLVSLMLEMNLTDDVAA